MEAEVLGPERIRLIEELIFRINEHLFPLLRGVCPNLTQKPICARRPYGCDTAMHLSTSVLPSSSRACPGQPAVQIPHPVQSPSRRGISGSRSRSVRTAAKFTLLPMAGWITRLWRPSVPRPAAIAACLSESSPMAPLLRSKGKLAAVDALPPSLFSMNRATR